MRNFSLLLVKHPLTICLIAFTLAFPSSAFARETVVFLTRHAEKQLSSGKDPQLTVAGKAQAVRLIKTLENVTVDAIFTTPYQRTTQTITPIAKHRGIKPHSEYIPADKFADMIKRDYQNKTVLLAGHSNTVPAKIKALGVSKDIQISESQYGQLFKVVIDDEGNASLTLADYYTNSIK